MKLLFTAALVCLPFAAHAQTDVKCAGWEVDRHFILKLLEANAEIVNDTLSDEVSADAVEAATALNAANQQAMSDFAETKRLFDQMCKG